VNAGDGTHEHPTQALLDAYTIRKRVHGSSSRGKGLDGLRVTIVGDIAHSRVARSNAWLLTTLGAEVTMVAPPTLLPHARESFPVVMASDLDAVLATNPDAVMMLRIQKERMHHAFFPSEREFSHLWGLTAERFARLSERTLVMHPGPMNRGLEICSEAADSEQSTIVEQVANGISVRMAVLFKLMSPERYSNV
jgi:aspartate carbamoyltransferase catalytic subunit